MNENISKEDIDKSIEESSSSSINSKKKKKFKFNAYEKYNNFEDMSYSFEDISILNEGDHAWIKKIGMIEMKKFKEKKENKNKTLKNIVKNKKNEDDSNNSINLKLYKLNLRDESSNALVKPFIITDKKGIFFKFFKKK